MAYLSILTEMQTAWLRMLTDQKHVLLIVGMNKVVKSEEDALHRARNEAAPINAQRFGIDTPCSKNGTCFDCKSPQCICCQILTTRFSRVKGRFQIILVDENLGFKKKRRVFL